MKIRTYFYAGLLAATSLVVSGTAMAQTFQPQAAFDNGTSHPSYPATNAFDGNTAFSSRWAAKFDNVPADLWMDLGSVKRIDDVGIAWGRGSSRTYEFEIWGRAATSGSWRKIFDGNSKLENGIQKTNVTDMDARFVRVKVFSNSARSTYADVLEFEVYGTSGRSGSNRLGSSTTPAPTPAPTPSNPGDERFNIPGRIEAEDFARYNDNDSGNRGGQYRDEGVDIQRCSDNIGCGFNVGWFYSGEWLEYDIFVDATGEYEVDLRAASRRSASLLSVSIDGRNLTGNIAIGNTGNWQNYVTRTARLGTLSRGNHTLRVTVANSPSNLNYIGVNRLTTDAGSNPPADDNPTSGNDSFGLNSRSDPWDNFDLSRWSLDTPAPRNDDRCRAERTWDYQWDDRNPLDSSSAPFFFTHSDGGMRFVTRIDGQTTNNSCNSGFVRSELREMLRRGDRDIDDTGVTRNNWKLGYQPGRNSNWGGVNGRMTATLRVNKVTTSGSSGQVGRVIIGQIHAGNDEPLRLYYRKRSGQREGCIYFAHEIRDDDDINFEMIGDRDCTRGPSNGIELDELFSYEIENDDNELSVVIRRGDRNGSVIARRTINMDSLNSDYDRSDEWMYFKLGAYTQNDSGNNSDGDIVTFYRQSVSHD